MKRRFVSRPKTRQLQVGGRSEVTASKPLRACVYTQPQTPIRATTPEMPKALAGRTLPLNGLFAIAKPSGPASMAILDRLKPLFANSPLFVPEADLKTYREQRTRIRNHHGKKMKPGRNNNKIVRMGQGGTLDPLADGVLGMCGELFLPSRGRLLTRRGASSYRSRQRH
jgi:hypothetical protein